MLTDQRFELRDEVSVAAQGKLNLDHLLDGGHMQLLEARDLALREGLGREVGERRPAPECERSTQRACRTLGRARGEEPSPFAEEALEPFQVELLGLERKQISAPARLQTPVA